jgi:LAO/AO transport system kinase
MSLAGPVLAGDRLALARLLSALEAEDPDAEAVLSEIFANGGRAHRIGVTGPPGTGKSTLVNHMAGQLRAAEAAPVAVVAVDPSSPFTGGALLGDRIRMRDLAGDPGVFIRSMASRGALGGLSRRTATLVEALDAAGYRWIFIETVGAGQAEVDVARLADTTLVVEAPGLGDEVQAIKAGILEIADILVVNKADLPGADSAARALRASLELGAPSAGGWAPPVLTTVAEAGQGVDRLLQAVQDHRRHLDSSGEGARRREARAAELLERELRQALLDRARRELPDGLYQQSVRAVIERRATPRQAAEGLLHAHA